MIVPVPLEEVMVWLYVETTVPSGNEVALTWIPEITTLKACGADKKVPVAMVSVAWMLKE